MTETETDIDAVLEELRGVLDEKSALESALNDVSSRKSALEGQIKTFAEKNRLEKFSGKGLSITVGDKLRARYDPAMWNEVFKWCAETGNTHIIQRRITDGKVEELIDSGVALPEGLTMEAYKAVSVRRTKN